MKYASVAAMLLVGLIAGYVISSNLSRSAPADELTVRVEKIQERAATYSIDVEYPQFGIPEIDANIKEKVKLSVAQFKKDTAQAPPVADSVVSRYELTGTFDSSYVGSDIVSVRMTVSTYTGGAHPNSIINGVSFDRVTGRELTPEDALALTGLSLEEVAGKAKAELLQKLGSDIIAPEGADPTPENYSTFIVDANSVTFVFQTYQIAPYAAGPQEVEFQRIR